MEGYHSEHISPDHNDGSHHESHSADQVGFDLELVKNVHFNSYGLVPLYLIMLQTNFDQKYKYWVMFVFGGLNFIAFVLHEYFEGHIEDILQCIINLGFLMFGYFFYCLIGNRIIKELLTSIVNAETSKHNLNLILDNLEASIIIIANGQIDYANEKFLEQFSEVIRSS